MTPMSAESNKMKEGAKRMTFYFCVSPSFHLVFMSFLKYLKYKMEIIAMLFRSGEK